MSTKNGFEIRLEVLKMAHDIMSHHYIEASNDYWRTIDELTKTWNKSAAELIEQTRAMRPAMYTPAEIAEKAQELYSFISKKD